MSNLGQFYYVCLLGAYTSIFCIRMRMRTCERLFSMLAEINMELKTCYI